MPNNEKTNLIDYVCDNFSVDTVADLGGIWGVDGAYTFYTLEKYDISRAYIIDTDITDQTTEKAKLFSQLHLVSDNFGNSEVVRQLKKVDVIFMFDVLLHQVTPNWNEILEMYSKVTDYFLVFNPQYIGEKTLRLIDSGTDEYFKNVPHSRDEEPYKSFVEKMYEIHPQHNRIYKDIHNVWQWGITNNDLIDTMKKFGFENIYHKNYGQWESLKNFENNAFIFKRVLV